MVLRNKRKAVIAVIAALLVGAMIGSFDQLSRLSTAQQPQSQLTDVKTDFQDANQVSEMQNDEAGSGQSIADFPTNTADTFTANSSSNNTIFLSGNVTMAPRREGGIFVGYEIVSAGSDDRFSTGDVITSINGVSVEDSAAGGELLIAALTSQNTRIEIRDQ